MPEISALALRQLPALLTPGIFLIKRDSVLCVAVTKPHHTRYKPARCFFLQWGKTSQAVPCSVCPSACAQNCVCALWCVLRDLPGISITANVAYKVMNNLKNFQQGPCLHPSYQVLKDYGLCVCVSVYTPAHIHTMYVCVYIHTHMHVCKGEGALASSEKELEKHQVDGFFFCSI